MHPVGGGHPATPFLDALEALGPQVSAQLAQIRAPGDQPARDERFGVEQIDAAARQLHVQQVARLQQPDEAAVQRFWRHVTHRRPVGGAGIAAVADQHGQPAQLPVGVDVLHGREHLRHTEGLRPLAADDHHHLQESLFHHPIEERFPVQRLEGGRLRMISIPILMAVVSGHGQQLFAGEGRVGLQPVQHVDVQQASVRLFLVFKEQHDAHLVVEVGELFAGHAADLDHRRLEEVAP